MAIVDRIESLDALLERYADTLGPARQPYTNHNYRVANFCIELAGCGDDAEAVDKIGIACAFHDIGVWTVGTLDYLEPSRKLAAEYLEQIGKSQWLAEIEAMVMEHHKLRTAGASAGPLVEPFRKADWIDVSLGLLRFGLSGEFIGQVKARFPNAGFHKLLMRATGAQLMRDPLHPMPMMRF
ncbi:HD domain-containing protein [Panacagrimonas sp.]|uniref:HD domain-containing protein n=1 Tax=Panacagrimonas sp. TaxID=2480088 RepID=UPI003B52719A